MTPLDELLLFSGLTFVAMLFIGKWRMAGAIAAVLYGGQLLALIKMGVPASGDPVPSVMLITVLDQPMTWRYDALSWFFALITVGAGMLSAWYASGVWGEKYTREGHGSRLFHSALALNVFTMLLLLGSGDFLSLFLGWELVSWASFLLMALGGRKAAKAALRYMTYAMTGAMAILGGMALLFNAVGSLNYPEVIAALPQLSNGLTWTLMLMLGGGFAIKMGLVPFHLWQAAAYAETPGPGSAFFGAISARMGLYAILVVLVQMVGIARFQGMEIPFTFLSARDLLAWIAVLTIILPTYTALKQNDARYLLAWHGIGQGGYMLLGLAVGNASGSAGGLLHVFNYAATQAVLLMTVFAVMHRTGTADLNKLGGLVARMPLSFVALLVGIISLAGIPPMSGFVSKWLVYRSLIIEGMPLLFVGSVIGTLGTILSVYKLIHNMFLGQLRVEHENVGEAPLSMLIPMLILALIVFLTGLMPGMALTWVAAIQQSLGLPVIEYSLGGVRSAQGSLDMLWVVGVMFAGFGVGAVLFYSRGKTMQVHQLDNYAGGHFLTAENRYQYSDNFYPGLMNQIGGWYRGSFQWLEGALASAVGLVSLGMSGLYRYVQPSLYLLVAAVISLAWVVA